jgi:hypothetical protein
MLHKRVQLARNDTIGFDTIFSVDPRGATSLAAAGSNSTGLRGYGFAFGRGQQDCE